jgi:geranylgeranyl pyrophosphate synthase
MVQDMIARYDSIAYTRQQADLYAKKACARLDAFPPSAAKQALEDLAASAARRRF